MAYLKLLAVKEKSASICTRWLVRVARNGCLQKVGQSITQHNSCLLIIRPTSTKCVQMHMHKELSLTCYFGYVALWVWRNIYLTTTNSCISIFYFSVESDVVFWESWKTACSLANWFYEHFTEYCIFCALCS